MLNEQNPTKDIIESGTDSVVVRHFVSGIHGGRTLDCSGIADSVLKAGHVVIKTAEGVYAPMPYADGKYAALPEGATYQGILYRSISVKNPAASIMVDGVVNPDLIPFPMDGIAEAFAKACPHIIFAQDEEA